MDEQASGDETEDPGRPPAAPVERRFRRTMLSTGFGDVPGKRCEVCGFEGFRWQKECPQGHSLT